MASNVSSLWSSSFEFASTSRALARNCNASLDKNKGNESKDWKAGKPVRVVRNCKGRKHSKYAPEDGNRYDGIYKVMIGNFSFSHLSLAFTLILDCLNFMLCIAISFRPYMHVTSLAYSTLTARIRNNRKYIGVQHTSSRLQVHTRQLLPSNMMARCPWIYSEKRS